MNYEDLHFNEMGGVGKTFHIVEIVNLYLLHLFTTAHEYINFDVVQCQICAFFT